MINNVMHNVVQSHCRIHATLLYFIQKLHQRQTKQEGKQEGRRMVSVMLVYAQPCIIILQLLVALKVIILPYKPTTLRTEFPPKSIHACIYPYLCTRIPPYATTHIRTHTHTHTGLSPSRSGQRQDSQGYQPEELNKRAVAITQRVKQKLTGMSVSGL